MHMHWAMPSQQCCLVLFVAQGVRHSRGAGVCVPPLQQSQSTVIIAGVL